MNISPAWRDALFRAVRTFVQAFIGLLLASLLGQNLAPGTVPTWDVLQRLLVAAAFGATIALLAYLQNALENVVGQGIARPVPPKEPL